MNDLAYGYPEGEGVAGAIGAAPPGMPLRLYRARVDGEVAARACGPSTSATTAASSGSATLPEHRGKRLASAAPARRRSPRRASAGCARSTLQASMLGRGVYERLGYEPRRLPASASTSGDVGMEVRRVIERRTEESSARAVEALSDPERFARAEAVVAAAAPQLQPVLAQALEAGGWFGDAHEAEVRKASAVDDLEQRVVVLRTLLAEEARMGMMVGVAVGLGARRGTENDERGDLNMEIRYHGHSCFELSEGDARVLIDPFLKPNNPTAVATADEVEPTQILVTHGHVDHMADAVGVAKRTGAPSPPMVEIANWFQARGIENVSDPNLGGTVEFDGAGRSSSRRSTRAPSRAPARCPSAPSTARRSARPPAGSSTWAASPSTTRAIPACSAT